MIPSVGDLATYNSIDGGRYDAKVLRVDVVGESMTVARVALDVFTPGSRYPVSLSGVRWSDDPACRAKQHACPREGGP